MRIVLRCVLAVVCVVPAFAQWELGAVGGYGFRRDISVQNASGGTAQLSFRPDFAFGFYGGQTQHGYLGGEIHYDYESSPIRLKSGSTETSTTGRTHVVHFDILVHLKDSNSRVRPFLAMGGGIKIYEGTGPDRAAQPLSNYVLLTRTHEVKPVMSPAIGMKVQVSRRVLFRAEARYFGGPRPENVIAPAPGAVMHGWVHDIVPLAGFTATF